MRLQNIAFNKNHTRETVNGIKNQYTNDHSAVCLTR